jgi:hypothetical protein
VVLQSGYLATGTLDLDDASDGDVTGGPTLNMALVEPGTLSALVSVHAETSSLVAYAEWQVSADGSSWVNAVAPSNPVTTSIAPKSILADADSIKLSVAGVVSDNDAIVTSHATVASILTLSGAGLNGVIGVGAISPPRSISIGTTSHSGSYNIVDAITVTGTDADGNVTTGTGTLTQVNGNETIEVFAGADGVDGFASVTSVAFPAMNDTAGHLLVGVLSEVLSLTALNGKYGDQAISPANTVTVTTAAHNGSYNTDDISVIGLDENGDAAYENLSIGAANGGQTLTTAGLFSSVQSAIIPAMVDASSSFQIGTSAVTQHDAELVLPAPPCVYGMPLARMSVRITGANGGSVDTYAIGYNFRRRAS